MKICIIKLSALGDIIHTSIVLELIKKHFLNSEIFWVCEKRFSGILKDHSLLSGVIEVELKEKKFLKSYKALKKAKKESFDIVIDFQGLLKSALVGKVLSKSVVGFDKNSTREGIASLFYDKKVKCDYSKNIFLRNLTLLSKALNFEFDESLILKKSPCFRYKDESFSLNLPKDKKNILVVVASSVKNKIYPIDKQISLINSLKNFNIFLSFSGEVEKNLAFEISKNTHAKLLEPLSLKNLALGIKEFDLIIGPDSGPTHLAFAQNRPSITIYGYTPHFRNSFITPKNLVIHSGKIIDAKNLNKGDECINLIEPDEILNLVKTLI